jgi:hypothetical protein
MKSTLIKKALRLVGHNPAKRAAKRDSIPEATEGDNRILDIATRYSQSDRLRLWALLQAVQHVARNGVEGDFVECGVWKGGNLILCGLMVKELQLDRRIWGFDTFEGMSMPTDDDFVIGRQDKAYARWATRQKLGFNDWSYASYEEVERNVRNEAGIDNITLVKGKVEDTLDRTENIPDKIAILRLDTDWYESTRKELEVLYPRLVRGGVLIVDDYGHWSGAKKAVDEYFAANPVWLHRIDYTARLHVKY